MNRDMTDGRESVLVTGGAGYIGSHTARALHEAGYQPVVFDNLSRGRSEAVRWGPLEVGDLRDPVRLKEVFSKYRPAAVVHLAGYAYVAESVADPLLYYSNNLAAGINLLEAMNDAGCRRLVFSSTCAVYGQPRQIPITEDHPLDPISPYGRTKMIFERMAADFGRAYGLNCLSLRYFNAAGAHPAGDLGPEHEPETRLVPLALMAVLGRVPVLDVYGTDYQTPDGTAVRDYIHVVDLANAHVLALQALAAGKESRAYNLGVGEGCSVKQVIEAVQRITGRPVPHRTAPPRPGDPEIMVADASQARKDLGWEPRLSSLATIVETAWRWLTRDS